VSRKLALALTLAAVGAMGLACSTRAPRRTVVVRPTPLDRERVIRVVLSASNPRIGSSSDFGWYEPGSRAPIGRGRRGELWRLEREPRGARVRAVRPDGVPTAWQRELIARTDDDGFLTLNGRRYRGQMVVLPNDSTVMLINRVALEDYLRGVVPVELGERPAQDSSALQAQAVASRSYAIMRIGEGATQGRAWDVRASVLDQVYGGADVENERSDDAVDRTRGLVVQYKGRLVDAPFHSTCGGSTAEASEIWRAPGAAYLQRVSDRIGNTNRYYCDAAPRYRWTRTLNAAQVNESLERYLAEYAAVPGGKPGRTRIIAIASHTASGRVGVLEVETDRGTYPLRGNDIRYVMRAPGGEILSSTYFSVEPEYGRDGLLTRVTFRGQGYGHGVGMCQWGAIGRARAGQSFRAILGTYYPGTTVGPVQ
jgi:stage II sporulation protein D